MQQISLKKLFAAGVFNGISALRTNENTYPFVTLVGKHGANNVYFGKKSAATIGAKYAVKDDVTAELANASICTTVNEAGETRYKLSLAGESEYTQESALEDLFGTSASADFDTVAFCKEFTTVDAQEEDPILEEEQTTKVVAKAKPAAAAPAKRK